MSTATSNLHALAQNFALYFGNVFRGVHGQESRCPLARAFHYRDEDAIRELPIIPLIAKTVIATVLTPAFTLYRAGYALVRERRFPYAELVTLGYAAMGGAAAYRVGRSLFGVAWAVYKAAAVANVVQAAAFALAHVGDSVECALLSPRLDSASSSTTPPLGSSAPASAPEEETPPLLRRDSGASNSP